jgi:hypothetical protein
MRAILAKNVEFFQTTIIYWQKLWESSMKLQTFEELGLQQKIVVQSFLFSSNNQGVVTSLDKFS